jgi:heme-degrading monooxygenase HmoA
MDGVHHPVAPGRDGGGSLPVVTVFRSRLREGVEEEYEPLAAQLLELAGAMEGFVDFKTFVADDGERVSIVTFDGAQSHAAWRDDPRHRAAQRFGRERLYESYRIAVCELIDERCFER